MRKKDVEDKTEPNEHSAASACYLDLALLRDDGLWIARGEVDGHFAFDGSGLTEAEAIGNFMLSNREVLGFRFGFVAGGQVKLSTIYGRARTSEEMGPNERKFLSR